MTLLKTPKQIEEETGREFADLCKELLDIGLSPTEIARKLKLRSSQYVSASLYNQRMKDKANIKYPQLAGKTIIELEELVPSITGMKYEAFLHEKYIVEGLSAAEIGCEIGQISRTIQRHIKKFGFTKTLSQARSDSVKKGVINYETIVIKSRRTRRKSRSFSNSQELLRNLFKNHLEERITEVKVRHSEIEIILGFDELGILGDLEVDIPIIVINTNEGSLKKYSIELNGGQFHSGGMTKKDAEKARRLANQGWRHFVINYSNSNTKMELRVKEIVKIIFSEVST